MVNTFGNNIVGAYTGGVQVIEIYSNGVKVWPVVTPGPANNEIWYTSSDGNVVNPYIYNGTDGGFGANIVSNTYVNGKGVITFDGPITRIGVKAFCSMPSAGGDRYLETITIPNSVTLIGRFAFYSDDDLVSFVIPDSVTYIGVGAFQFCRNITSLIVPDSVTTLWGDAFQDMNSLTSLILSRSLTEIGSDLCEGCDSLMSITIPSRITKIGSGAFCNCPNLEEVIVEPTIPPTLEQTSDNRYVNFNNTSPNLQIKVPAASLNDYLTAPGWSTYASKIVGYSDADEIDFSTLGLENQQVVDVDTYGTFSSGDMRVYFSMTDSDLTPCKYYVSGTAVRLYRENFVVISSSKTISQIEFTWSGSDTYRPSSDVATPSGYDYQTYIWTGSANQVTLTRPDISGTWRLKSIRVTYQ